MRGGPFILVLIAVAAAIFAFGRWLDNSYAFFVAYVVVQYIVLGTAWNILGGYTGYVNFGITAFFRHRRLLVGRPAQARAGDAAAGDDRGGRRDGRHRGRRHRYLTLRLRGCSSPSPRWRSPWWCRR
jgi:hypothetical protein